MKGHIQNILAPGSLHDEAALLLANALYFKGIWNRKFDKTHTRNMKFHLLNGKNVHIPFMTSKNTSTIIYMDHSMDTKFSVFHTKVRYNHEQTARSSDGNLPEVEEHLGVDVPEHPGKVRSRSVRFAGLLQFGLKLSRFLI
ncbi:hypothetical protein HYC85_012972 [Camellia sinensis]|uniref:Serpin domain-containing protein n=1 Tax=Camellia sinensis TaxID=4442 RepID=A0A7J7HE07_CAMSI|nr:hypothetical protein HYC85_012972 [Camellia sinensis]